MNARLLIPLALFLGVAGFLAVGLTLDPKKVPSPLIGKAVPEFSLPTLDNPEDTFSNKDLEGQVSLFNIWATWCVSCRAEHQLLMALAETGSVALYGLNYKDKRPDARRWLQVLGNPYRVNAFDADGRVGIDWGVYGTPETFVIDRHGVIRDKIIGPVTADILSERVIPLIQRLQSET